MGRETSPLSRQRDRRIKMSFNVTFYSFSKKLNSTKRPGTSIPSTTYSCDIKDSSNVTNPVLLMSYDFNDKINSLYNYCYIDIWKRYYFIKNFRYNSGLWEISLDVDVLATWKTYIGNSSQYIARSASKNNDDKYIDDLLIPTWHTDRQPQADFTNNFFGNNPKGTYVLGVKGPQSASNAGAITYYTLTQTGMNKVIETLCDSAFSGYKDIGTEMLKSQYDPYRYIASCKWFPYTVNSTKAITAINFGWYTVNVPEGQAGIAADVQHFYTNTLRIPKHSQENIVGKFLNSSKFFTINMYIPGYGVYDLNPDLVSDHEFLEVHLTVDHATGQGVYSLDLHDELIINSPIAILNCNIGVDMPIVSMQINYPTLNSNISTSNVLDKLIGDFLSLTFPATLYQKGFSVESMEDSSIGGSLMTAYRMIGAHVNGSSLSVNSIGSTGNRSIWNYHSEILIWGISNIYSAPSYSDVGHPYYEHDTISNHSGYLLVINPHIEAPATNTELMSINNFVGSGFFYE